MSIEEGYKPIFPVTVTSDPYNEQSSLFQSMLNRVNTCALVKVVKVNATQKQINVQPLITMVDGYNNAIPHGIVYNIPYLQYQFGNSAIIATPSVNDIGVCVFAQNDISNVKATQKESLPASFRQFSYSDGIYISGVLNPAATQYIEFLESGINIVTDGDLNITSSSLKHNGVNIGDTHTHSGVQAGSGNTGAPN